MWGVEGYILRGGIKHQIYSGPRILCGLSVRKAVGWKGRKVKKGGEKQGSMSLVSEEKRVIGSMNFYET